jgi:hypothetical protein
MDQENRPYQELRQFDTLRRKFKEDAPESELVWHRDRNDRQVTIIGETDWMFQLEDELPQQLKDTVFIPRNTYHRLIKGTGDLMVQILEL